ncbi:MAG: carbohydrate-binding family 9-like protein [Verrucomicrobia bacterium]|nr:carbohydrate-binding family 9-like protein [Verrucomicrobiota bacterium]
MTTTFVTLGRRRISSRAFLVRCYALAALILITHLFQASAAQPVRTLKTMPPPKRVHVPKFNAVVTIDGELNEPVWKKAAVLKPFFKNDGSGRERENTEVRVWYDDTVLYLGWTCQDADIQATFTARDSKFWEEEVAEFFITPHDLGRYFELQWNPLGGVFDAIIENQLDARGVSKSFQGDWSFTAKGMKSAVKVKGTVGNSEDKDEFWQVEVMIPFADLGQRTPKPRDVWRANFYRFNRQKNLPAELLSWSPTLFPGFHEPSRFGYLEFGK